MTHHLAIDYLATARAHADDATAAAFGSPTYLAHLAAATAFGTLAIAETARRAIATALPQGTEDAAGATPCTVGSAPSPAEPSLVALDAAEAVVTTARHLKALWREDVFRQSSAWWIALDALLRSVEALDTEAAHPVPDAMPAEPSLVALDRAEAHEAQMIADYDELRNDYSNLSATLAGLRGELRRWREADRIFPVDAAEWWDATLRLRDMIDRLGAEK